MGAIAFAAGTEGDEHYNRLVSAAEQAGTEVVYLEAGDRVSISERAALEVWYPQGNSSGSGNEYSLVVHAEVSGTRFLFTGDIGEETEAELVPRLRKAGGVDVLKVPHHGSRYSSSSGFLHAAGGEGSIAVISCGRNNIYGHPAKETLERLTDAGFTLYRTDRNGAVILDLP